MKIERNGLCPCQSGEKYKKCCLKHPERMEAAQSLNAQYVDTGFVLSDFKARSTIFAKFLDDIPEQLLDLLWVFVNPSLNANMRSAAGYGHLVIIVRQWPLPEEDFFDFAHEITHIVLGLNGYPGCKVLSGDLRLISLGTVLTNTIMDPLVNQRVVQYGFDFTEYIQKSFRMQLDMLKFPTPNTVEDRHSLRCLCIEKILEWRMLEIPFVNLFLPIFEQYHPCEYRFALDFVNSIDISRLGEPNYVRELLSQLIHENQMQDTLGLVNFV